MQPLALVCALSVLVCLVCFVLGFSLVVFKNGRESGRRCTIVAFLQIEPRIFWRSMFSPLGMLLKFHVLLKREGGKSKTDMRGDARGGDDGLKFGMARSSRGTRRPSLASRSLPLGLGDWGCGVKTLRSDQKW